MAWSGEGENIVIEKRYQRRMRSVKKYLQINDGEKLPFVAWQGVINRGALQKMIEANHLTGYNGMNCWVGFQ